MDQTYEPIYKNRIRGIRCRTSEQLIAKSISIKGTGCKSGGCVPKAVEITSGDLLSVSKSRLGIEQSVLTKRQKSADGIVLTAVRKAWTVPRFGVEGRGK